MSKAISSPEQKNSIPMVDPKTWHRSIQTELEQAALRVLRSGRFVSGTEVACFEQQLASYLGCNHAVSCANGTDALTLALTAAGVGLGDEVITTPFSFFASAEAILTVGAVPVFVDIEPETFNLDPRYLTAALSKRTKAVLAVHLFGLPARILEIKEFCEVNELILIEDCAQSFGAETAGMKTGCFGDFGCFSFFPSKNLGGFGDGGLVITKHPENRDKLLKLKNHGSSQPYQHDIQGFNSRLDELQAALLAIKLKHIEQYNRQRKHIAQCYSEGLAGCELLLPSGSGHVFHQYTIQVDDRDSLQQWLTESGIASAVYYSKPLHQQPVFRNDASCRLTGDLFVAEQLSQKCLSLPIYPGMPESQCQQVITAVKSALVREQSQGQRIAVGV